MVFDERTKFDVMLFSLCKKEDSNKASMNTFLEHIRRTGIRPYSDPRLAPIIEAIKQFKSKPSASMDSVNLDLRQFQSVIDINPPLIMKIMRNELVIPEFGAFCENVEKLFYKLKNNMDGKPASYIPQLARVPKDKWALSICTVDGQRFSIGDADDKFTIQSTSKPITYALTLEELGADVVHKYQGREPSGRMFNEIVLDHNNQPHNPMVNSGAIMSASLLLLLVKPEMNTAQKYDYVYNFFKRMAGGEYLGFNNSIFLSERDTADRNFALAYFLRENLCFPPGHIDIASILDFYFQTCSLEMSVESESVMAATLANGGVCPITGEALIKPESVRNVLSLMLSCGLYNYSGDFAFKVGLPAKSGVSGALMLVVPNVMGICFWSPALDEMGNTVRGVQFCEEFVQLYNFHAVNCDLSFGSTSLIDPRRSKYDEASHAIIHLLMAASVGDETSLKCTHQLGVDMNISDYDGRTALHLAAVDGHLRCVRFLLEVCGVKHDPKDRWGQTPLQEAINFKQTQVAAFLKRYDRTKANGYDESGGEALWRKLVEIKLMPAEEKRRKSVIKFDKKIAQVEQPKPLTANVDETGGRGSIRSRCGSGFSPGSTDLSTVMENETNGQNHQDQEWLDIHKERAAKIIQDRYRDRLRRRRTHQFLFTSGQREAKIEADLSLSVFHNDFVDANDKQDFF